MEIILDLDLKLEPPRVLRLLGGSSSQEERYGEMIPGMVSRARELLEPVVLYDLFPVEEARPGEVALKGATLRSKGLAKLWARAQEVALVLCTLGPALDEQVSAYFAASDPLRGLVLDAVGNAALEELTEEICGLVEGVAKERGQEASAPLSPGNLDWPVEEQKIFFDLLPAREIGLSLTSNYQMIPLKSLSLALALGQGLHPAAGQPPCSYCSLSKRCQYRRG